MAICRQFGRYKAIPLLNLYQKSDGISIKISNFAALCRAKAVSVSTQHY
ncbi:hypothetical protein SAMN05421636_103386 [Pricia antarctica]|uniref:Uncharacterized protein n=1 Tax=Pricia antarctica TaxID=641691 RepID=A0A1G7AK37_9FLAO|nr:hypothetical protein SAMN05421636_103386 [Pricia antarctica]